MQNLYNTDEMVTIVEKCYTDFKEFKQRFYSLMTVPVDTILIVTMFAMCILPLLASLIF